MVCLRYEPNKANRIIKLCIKMPIPEVHACWPPKYVYGVLDLSVNVEVEGNAKTMILSFCMVCLRYEPNKANRISNYVLDHECGGGRER